MKNFYFLLHLNLQFSAIPFSKFKEVISNVYHPILDLISEHNLHLSLEISGYTIEKINEIDIKWTQKLRKLLLKKKMYSYRKWILTNNRSFKQLFC